MAQWQSHMQRFGIKVVLSCHPITTHLKGGSSTSVKQLNYTVVCVHYKSFSFSNEVWWFVRQSTDPTLSTRSIACCVLWKDLNSCIPTSLTMMTTTATDLTTQKRRWGDKHFLIPFTRLRMMMVTTTMVGSHPFRFLVIHATSYRNRTDGRGTQKWKWYGERISANHFTCLVDWLGWWCKKTSAQRDDECGGTLLASRCGRT